MAIPNFLRTQPDGVLLSIKLQPRASANEIVPHHGVGDELRIRVTAPPVDAAANEALVRLLVERLDCARSSVELVRGHKSRHKVVRLHGFKPAEVLKRLGLVPSVSKKLLRVARQRSFQVFRLSHLETKTAKKQHTME
ncbi:MAG: DUF167 domain-containing protein [Limisphaerales bacterium]